MTPREIFPGVFHWTVFHDPIKARVSSYYVQPAGIVIDPKVPEGGLEALPDEPQQVVLTSGHHRRDAERFADAFGIPIRASREAAAYLGDTLRVEPFGDRDELAPGVTVIYVGKLSEDEGALHLAYDKGALAFADGVNRYGKALAFFPDQLLGDDPQRVKDELKQAFNGLLTLEFDHLLFAHGEPLVGGGKAALRDFVRSPVGHEDFGQAL
jgi:glycosyltransferase involved in cell wall biosynthesis